MTPSHFIRRGADQVDPRKSSLLFHGRKKMQQMMVEDLVCALPYYYNRAKQQVLLYPFFSSPNCTIGRKIKLPTIYSTLQQQAETKEPLLRLFEPEFRIWGGKF